MATPTPDEAIEWLKASGRVPDISWRLTEDPGDRAYARIIEILFPPSAGEGAARRGELCQGSEGS